MMRQRVTCFRFQRQRSSGEHKVKDVAGDVSDSSGTDIGS